MCEREREGERGRGEREEREREKEEVGGCSDLAASYNYFCV